MPHSFIPPKRPLLGFLLTLVRARVVPVACLPAKLIRQYLIKH